MKSLDFLPRDAQASEYLPGRWHVQLDGVPLFAIQIERGAEQDWLQLSASLPRAGRPDVVLNSAFLEELLDLQERLVGIKFSLPVDAAAPQAQLRAELPIPKTTGNPAIVAWRLALFDQFVEALSHVSGSAARRPPTQRRLPCDDETLGSAVELGFAAEVGEDGAVGLRVPVGGETRQLKMTRLGSWVRLEMPIGTAVVQRLEEPTRKALLMYLLRVSGCVKLARAACQEAGDDGNRLLSFAVDLPTPAGDLSLDHAISAIATAVRQFEKEIETLASEVILAHAYLAITGGANRATSSTPEL